MIFSRSHHFGVLEILRVLRTFKGGPSGPVPDSSASVTLYQAAGPRGRYTCAQPGRNAIRNIGLRVCSLEGATTSCSYGWSGSLVYSTLDRQV